MTPTFKLILRGFSEDDFARAYGAYLVTINKYPDSKVIVVRQGTMTKAVLVKRNKHSVTAMVEPW